MKTPIYDFVKKYIRSGTSRLHMPGHKGVKLLGFEKYDITEMKGADSLYEADGIIKESEENAGKLFGADTFYSTEGSSHCIRAMLYLATLKAKENGKKPLILAGRNAHKAFLSAVTLLDIDVKWLYGENSYLSCVITPEKLEKVLGSVDKMPTAVYITSPDYLGNMCDISLLSKVCEKYGTMLLVDNAHGAYLKYLDKSMHPMDLGAAMCCDSAHKTLPALTGGAYLHISKKAEDVFKNNAKHALAMFGTTSPSYLILQSLDLVNKYIADGYAKKLNSFLENADRVKAELIEYGYVFVGDERLKFTLDVKQNGYTGVDFAHILRKNHKIECEFADNDYVVLMLSPDNKDLARVKRALMQIERKSVITDVSTMLTASETVMSVREAMLSPNEKISVDDAEGRILGVCTVSCPPAVPILMPGERINKETIPVFKYYGISTVKVIK